MCEKQGEKSVIPERRGRAWMLDYNLGALCALPCFDQTFCMDMKFLRMWFISMNLIRKKVIFSVHADLLGFLTRGSPGELTSPCIGSSVYRKKCEIILKTF